MKKGIVLFLVLLCLTGCTGKTTEFRPEPVDATVTVPMDPELPENIVSPDRMPTIPEDSVGIPAPPQPTIVTE